MTRKAFNDPAQTLLFADVTANGLGGFTITPRKPVNEITSKQAAKILSVSRANLNYMLDQPQAQRILRWRWLSEKKGKRVFELESVIAYRDATRDPEFGGE
jgi:hypothetical protein